MSPTNRTSFSNCSCWYWMRIMRRSFQFPWKISRWKLRNSNFCHVPIQNQIHMTYYQNPRWILLTKDVVCFCICWRRSIEKQHLGFQHFAKLRKFVVSQNSKKYFLIELKFGVLIQIVYETTCWKNQHDQRTFCNLYQIILHLVKKRLLKVWCAPCLGTFRVFSIVRKLIYHDREVCDFFQKISAILHTVFE